MMKCAAPGQLLLSAVNGDQVTSVADADEHRSRRESGLKPMLFFLLQISSLLAFVLGWFYLIYWQVQNYSATGAFRCWPMWLCG